MSAMNVGHACTKAVLLGGLVAFTGTAAAQLTMNQQADPQQLAQTIAGAGVRIANPVIDCHVDGFGEFSYTGSLLGINEGIILTSGTVDNAIGPNNVSNKSFQQYRPGSALLDVVTGRTTHDACRFEFDVIPGGDSLHFDFVFASEEYNEWVGSQYNDVFGFFISGPGITGDAGIGSDHNIALIPNSTQAVTINNGCHCRPGRARRATGHVKGTIFQSDGTTPAPGIVLYFYQTDASGRYTPANNQTKARRHGHLRGWVKSDAKGKYSFTTVTRLLSQQQEPPTHSSDSG